MFNSNVKMAAHFFKGSRNPELFRQLCAFRKALFIDHLEWDLPHYNGEERDSFDTDATLYCALTVGAHVVGGFRAINTTSPYLAQEMFPRLATLRPYPNHSDYWEISRFGMLPPYAYLGLFLHALIFHFALSRHVKALVAVVDERRERHLRKIGLCLTRYGTVQDLGPSLAGDRLYGVAGEIPMSEQNFTKLRELIKLTHHMEVKDDTLVFRSGRIPA